MSTDSLRMVIRKQLSSPLLKYKRMGIIGGVTLAGRLSRVSADARSLTPSPYGDEKVANRDIS
jgi:hypothetical protein